jgi:hypothetical protein
MDTVKDQWLPEVSGVGEVMQSTKDFQGNGTILCDITMVIFVIVHLPKLKESTMSQCRLWAFVNVLLENNMSV